MKFWKEHNKLRICLILLFFVAGMALLIYGWTLTGKLKGLAIMLAGLAMLLFTLWLYNSPYAGKNDFD